MVHSRGRPTAGEWQDIREEFEHMYLRQNLTLNTIKEHFIKRGFSATDRQYKTKVKAWDLDRKKIKAPTWHSMYVVMRDRTRRGLTSVFLVPIRGDHLEVVRSDRIIKQINRDRTEFDGNNLSRAEDILKEGNVQIYTEEEAVRHEYLPPSRWTDRSQVMQPEDPSQGQGLIVFEDQVNGSSTDSTSPTSSHSRIDSIPIHNGTESVRSLPSIGQSTTISTLTSTSTASMPFLRSSVSGNLHRTYAPYAAPLPSSPSALTPPVIEHNDATEILFFDRSCSNLQGSDPVQQAHLLKNLNRFVHMDDERSLAVKWTAPYVQALLDCSQPRNRGLWRPGERESAKAAFHQMLKRSNKYIFPYSNWVVTVLASNAQTVLLTEFLQDCCDVINQDDQAFSMFYGSSLHLTFALYTKNEVNVENYRAGFLKSMETIRMIWSERSENYLVNQCYHAWLMLEQGHGENSIAILTQHLEATERLVGRYHVVTLNYLTTLARAFAQTGRLADAMEVLKDVSERLNGCAEVLEAYRYRQILRLADHQIETGDEVAAERNLEEVIRFRRNRFGMDADFTQTAINMLAGFLKQRGRFEDLARLLKTFQDPHDQYSQQAANR